MLDIDIETHQVWSDNIILYEVGREGLLVMLTELTAALSRHGLRWKSPDVQFLSASAPNPEPMLLHVPPLATDGDAGSASTLAIPSKSEVDLLGCRGGFSRKDQTCRVPSSPKRRGRSPTASEFLVLTSYPTKRVALRICT